MKYFVRVMNIILLLLVPTVILRTDAATVNKIDSLKDIKYVKSVVLPKKEIKTHEVKEEKQEEAKEEKKEEVKEEKTVQIQKQVEVKEDVKEVSTQTTTVQKAEVKSDVLQTLTGSMSGYGPDCRGCSGKTSTGHNLNTSIYYNDKTYGSVRIVAGDRSLPYGTIVRVKNSRLGTFNAIVLDRGGAVGIGKSHMFDLAFATEADASRAGTSYNVTFEILRKGY